MKPIRAIVACAVAVLSAVASGAREKRERRCDTAAPASINVDALLNAIAAVESGNSPHKVGEHGERGRCQFMPTTWRQYTDFSFYSWAGTNSAVTAHVERAHLAWIIRQLGAGVVTPRLIAAAWRHGPSHAAHFSREDYARRVANLYSESVKGEGE